MVVEVRLYATLRRYVTENPNGVINIEAVEGSSVLELVQQLGIDPTEIHLTMINGVGCDLMQTVKSGDRIGLFPPVGGG